MAGKRSAKLNEGPLKDDAPAACSARTLCAQHGLWKKTVNYLLSVVAAVGRRTIAFVVLTLGAPPRNGGGAPGAAGGRFPLGNV